jgi:hypothetical protein
MKKSYISIMLMIFFLCVLNIGCNNHDSIETCPTKYTALAETEKVTGDPSKGIKLFEITDIDTKCYKELRIFVHVMNDYYETKPFTSNAFMTITAFHGIGTGSWGYYSEKFPMKYTSEFHGFVQIPVMGDKTRLVVFGYYMPDVELKVNVASYFVK